MSGVPDYTLEDTLDFKFTSRRFSTGAPFALASGAIEIYEDNSATQITGAETLSLEFDGVTGLHNLRVVATAANGFENGKSYQCVLSVGTVDSVSVVGEVVQQFSIGRGAAAVDLANGTDGLGAIKAETALILTDTEAATAVLTDTEAVLTDTEAAIGERSTLLTDTEALLVDTEAAIVDTAAILVDTEAATGVIADTEAILADTETATAVITDTEAILADTETGLTERATLLTDTEAVLVDTEAATAVLSDTEAIITDTEAVLADTEAATTSVLTTQMTESYAANGVAPTLAQAMFAMHQMLMDFSIAGTTMTVEQLDGTTAFLVTLDDATDPTGANRA